jgi:cyclic beta-1,2-glucan synthetase
VVAADVYTAEGHDGRGGWSGYTGSASWMYRVGLEAILGLTKRGDSLHLDPRGPAGWDQFAVSYRHGGSRYEITVYRPAAARRGNQLLSIDGRDLDGEAIHLLDDGATHRVVIRPRHG